MRRARATHRPVETTLLPTKALIRSLSARVQQLSSGSRSIWRSKNCQTSGRVRTRKPPRSAPPGPLPETDSGCAVRISPRSNGRSTKTVPAAQRERYRERGNSALGEVVDDATQLQNANLSTSASKAEWELMTRRPGRPERSGRQDPSDSTTRTEAKRRDVEDADRKGLPWHLYKGLR